MRIVRIETIHLRAYPFLLFVRVQTEDGLIGTSETFYKPEVIGAYIHGTISPRLLGKDARDIQRHWADLYLHEAARFGGIGAELRAISAIDTALWDLAGQALGVPIYRLLGGPVRDRLRTYNTCYGPTDTSLPFKNESGPMEDLYASMHHPEDLAEELLSDGITGMKIWPFDSFALANEGLHISAAEIDEGLDPVRRIRDAVGNKIDIMIEGHGYWRLPAAVKIARALEEYQPAWIEDLLLPHDVEALASLHNATSIPLLASEMLITRHQYRPILERRAADIVMIDPTWSGGITESHKIGILADSFSLPIAMHDATGPFTTLAGIQLAFAAPNAIYQETVRAWMRGWYRDLITPPIEVVDGWILPPQEAGIGGALLPSVTDRQDAEVVVSVLES